MGRSVTIEPWQKCRIFNRVCMDNNEKAVTTHTVSYLMTYRVQAIILGIFHRKLQWLLHIRYPPVIFLSVCRIAKK